METAGPSPTLTLALAIAVGVLAQVVARHLSLPGIVLLLAAGVLLGPEVLGWVQPQALGPALRAVVGFSVAVILFEGALALDVRRLRQQGTVIRRLVTEGAALTAAGGALAAHLLMRWDWRTSLLFGTLVMVTGPTVINPLLRRIGVTRQVHTVLEAEGIFVDAVGAIVAVVALELALRPAEGAFLEGVRALGLRWAVGLGAGAAGGALLRWVLRRGRLVPEGMENAFTLSVVWVAFQGANALVPESGIIAVIAAGVVLGAARLPATRGLLEFKEQLTVLLLGMLFVLLAADVRLAEVTALGWRGLLTVLCLMAVVRPLCVAVSTRGSSLSVRERAFLAWLAPRGIVAAAVASLFATVLRTKGVGGGEALRALVFLVIAVTVVVQGLSGGWVARLLGVRRAREAGYVVLGANALARLLGRALREEGEEVLVVDANAEACRRAEEEGFRVLFGNALEERTLLRSEPDTRRGFVGLTPNEGVNLLFARLARRTVRSPRVWVAVHRAKVGVTPRGVEAVGGATLFGAPRDLDAWVGWAERGEVLLERWRYRGAQLAPERDEAGARPEGLLRRVLLPLLVRRGEQVLLVDDALAFAPEDVLWLAVAAEREGEGHAWLTSHGWEELPLPLGEGRGEGESAKPESPASNPPPLMP